MGTTADKLQNILNAKEAIRTKFNLPDDLPFIQYADNINAGTSTEPDTPDDPDVPTGVNTDFFLCKSFEYAEGYAESNFFTCELLAAGQPIGSISIGGTSYLLETATLNFERTLRDQSLKEMMWEAHVRVRTSTTADYDKYAVFRLAYVDSEGGWIIKCSDIIIARATGVDDINTAAGDFWQGESIAGGSEVYGIQNWEAISQPAFEGYQNWTGARVVLTSDGYAVDETSTETMMQFNKSRIVQVGHIYNSDATIEAAWLYKNLEPQGKFICSYVNRNYFSLDKIIVSGMPEAPWVGGTYIDSDWNTQDLPEDVAARNPNGEYILTNPDAQYTSSMIWLKEDGCAIMGHPDSAGFVVVPGQDYRRISKGYIQSYYDWENPTDGPSDGYESLVWEHYNGSSTVTLEGAKVAPPIPEPVEKYWEGYKLYQDENGKWNYESELTRLTYGDYMPVQGRIYDAMPTMEIGNIDFSEEALWSCPRNMTSDENDEWKVSAHAYYDDRYPWQAFDDDILKIWNAGTTGADGDWLQWQNKKRKVLIKELCIYCDDYMQWNKPCFLQGSDDGVTWTDLRRGVFAGEVTGDHVYEDGCVKVVVKLPNNGTAFYYHRFGHAAAYTSPWVRHVIARPQLERTVPETAPKVSDRNEV